MSRATIQVNRNAVKAMLLFAARIDIRYYLRGVLIEATPSATRMVATNGHILAIHHSVQSNEVDGPTSIIVPRQAVELLRAQGPTGAKGLLRDVQMERAADGWLLRDHTNGIRLGFDGLDEGKFPNYQKVVPEKVSGELGTFNPSYIGVVAQAAKALKSEPRFVTIGHNGRGAALVRIGNVPEFLAVVMPMRDDYKAVRPAWMEQSLIAAPSAAEPATEPEVA